MKYISDFRIRSINNARYVCTVTTKAGEKWTTGILDPKLSHKHGHISWTRTSIYERPSDTQSIPNWMRRHLESYGWLFNDPMQRSKVSSAETGHVRLPFSLK